MYRDIAAVTAVHLLFCTLLSAQGNVMSDVDSSSAPAAGGCSFNEKIGFCEDTAPPMLALC